MPGPWIDVTRENRLIAATLPGRDDSNVIGRRHEIFTWSDTHRETLARRSGCLTPGGHVIGALGHGKFGEATQIELAIQAEKICRRSGRPRRHTVCAPIRP